MRCISAVPELPAYHYTSKAFDVTSRMKEAIMPICNSTNNDKYPIAMIKVEYDIRL
jgi:hypothetical protein